MDRIRLGVITLSLCGVLRPTHGHNYENMAVGKTYDHSSVHSPHSPGFSANPASHAANGNTDGTYSSANCIHTEPTDPDHWWEVDLGAAFPLYNFKVWGRSGYNHRLYPFNITVDGRTCATVSDSLNRSRSYDVTCSSIVRGQVVRITRTSDTEPLNLCEFQVFACQDGWWGQRCDAPCIGHCVSCDRSTGECTVNMALGKTYNHSSAHVPNTPRHPKANPASYAANGKRDGRYNSHNCFRTADNDPDDWWEVDLGKVYPLYDFKIWGRSRQNNWLFPLIITVDGQHCTSVLYMQYSARSVHVTCSSTMYGQVVRLSRASDLSPLSLCEFEVFVCHDGWWGQRCDMTCPSNCPSCARPTGHCTVNVAPGKTYRHSETTNGYSIPANNAANGNTGGTYDSTNCIHMRSYHKVWWEVDLGRVYSLYNFKVWARFQHIQNLYPYSIIVDGELCVGQPFNPQLERSIDMTCSSIMLGQVVRITRLINMIRTLDLCEFQVFVCQDGWWGKQCDRPCNSTCLSCDRSTGTCSAVNVALGKTYTHSSEYAPHNRSANPASYAANGNTDGTYSSTNCMHTEPNDPDDWWEVDLGTVYPLYTFRIWGQDNWNQSLYPITITVDGLTCASVISGTTRSVDVTCTSVMYGQVVRITRPPDNETLNLCEVQVWVCQDGWWGEKCESLCNCASCNRSDGSCAGSPCTDGRWGANCEHQCSDNCATCDRDTGSCSGCSDGYYGAQCQQKCLLDVCQRCDQYSGVCQACHPGHNVIPPNCTECVAGTFRRHPWLFTKCFWCSGTCRQDTVCNPVSGDCHACPPGKRGLQCQHDCPYKTYGTDCAQSCGQCRDGQVCDPVTGHCPDGCHPGWTDPDNSSAVQLCKTACPAGLYGEGCNQTCGHCRDAAACGHQTGLCRQGCADGYTGPLCLHAIPAQNDQSEGLEILVGPLIGSTLGLGPLSMGIAAAVCWRRRSRHKTDTMDSGKYPAEGPAVVQLVRDSVEPRSSLLPPDP